MPVILLIETATAVCSVALTKEGQVFAVKETSDKNSHSEVLNVFIDQILKENSLSPRDLNAVAVSKGPGSYTGLRIGVSTAKGICWGLDLPLISVGTIEAMARGMSEKFSSHASLPVLYAPMIDARRMEVYTGLFRENQHEVLPVHAAIVDGNTFAGLIENHIICIAGDGAEKCRQVLNHPNFRFIDDFNVSSAFMSGIAQSKFNSGIFEDTAYFEPYYLKDFVAGLPKVKGLS